MRVCVCDLLINKTHLTHTDALCLQHTCIIHANGNIFHTQHKTDVFCFPPVSLCFSLSGWVTESPEDMCIYHKCPSSLMHAWMWKCVCLCKQWPYFFCTNLIHLSLMNVNVRRVYAGFLMHLKFVWVCLVLSACV